MKNFDLNTYSKALLQLTNDGTADPRVLQILKKNQKLFLGLGLQQGGHQNEQDVFSLGYVSFFDAKADWNPLEGTFEAWVVGKFSNEMKRMTADLAAVGHGTIELDAPTEYAGGDGDGDADGMHDRATTGEDLIQEGDRFEVVDNMVAETLDAFIQPSTTSLISLISAGQSIPQSALKMGQNVRTVQREFKKMKDQALSIRIASMKLAGLSDSLILDEIQNVEKPDRPPKSCDVTPPSYRKQLGLAQDLMASKLPVVKPVAEVNVQTARGATLRFVQGVAPQHAFDFGCAI